MDSENTLMTEICIRDMTAEGGLVHYMIEVGDWKRDDKGFLRLMVNWEMDDHATTLDGAYKMITHNLKWDYREYERDLEV